VQPRGQYGLLIVAIRRANKSLEFNPGGDTVFEAGSSVVVLGGMEDIDRFRAAFGI
jgi:Trk K+ transport system NAD-binding subunit